MDTLRNRFNRFNSGRVMFFLLAFIAVIILAAVLRITSSVLMPFTVAVFLAFVTYPIVNYLERFRIPRIVSALIVILLLFSLLLVMVMILYTSGQRLITLYPRYEVRIREIYIWVALIFELPYDEYMSIFDNIWGQADVRTQVREMTLAFTNGLINFITNAFMVALFMIFLLFEAVYFREKLDNAFSGERAEKIKKISADVMTQVTRYLFIKFVISAFTGVVVGIGLWFVGVELAVVWGLIQFILNFIPNIGSIAAGVGATIFALVQFWPEPWPVVAAGTIMLASNMIIGNFIDPKITGERLGISPLVVIVSLMIWGWIWGFAGMILAVPMMVIIKIVCENIPVLEPIAILMSSRKSVTVIVSEELPKEDPTDYIYKNNSSSEEP